MLRRRTLSRRRPRSSSRRLRWLVGVCLCLIGLLYYKPVRSYVETHGELARRSAEVRALARENRALGRRVELAESGATLVRTARRLGLVRPGERLFIVKGIAELRSARGAGR